MNDLKIYRIKDDYIEYLHDVDYRVQLNKMQRRPYVGVVLNVGTHEYFVPLESPKPSHAKLRKSVTIMFLEEGKYGLMGFNNMIPVPREATVSMDIGAEPDKAYQNLLWNQIRCINRNKMDIYARAYKTYHKATNATPDSFFKRNCCDFKKLELALEEYIGAK